MIQEEHDKARQEINKHKGDLTRNMELVDACYTIDIRRFSEAYK